jgi:hypothetical protein
MESALVDLVRELDDPERRRDPELEVDIEMGEPAGPIDEMLLDPWFLRSEAEIALLEDDPDARVLEIFIATADPLDFH